MEEEMNIGGKATQVIDLSYIGLESGALFNPTGDFSLLKLNNGNWLCSMRMFGYWISSLTRAYLTGKNMRLEHPDEHLFLELDGDFNILRRFRMKRNTYFKHPIFNDETPYLEDGRLVKWGDEMYFASAIFYQNHEKWQKFGIEIQRLEIVGDCLEAHHVWSSVEHGLEGRHKNWMAVPDKPFKYVIGTSPHGSQIIDISTGRIESIGRFDIDNLYRGNTNLIKNEDGYFTLTHRLSTDELGRKKYLEYIVKFNQDLMPTQISRPFKMTNSDIEFVTVMLEDGHGNIKIGVTEMDETPYLMEFDKDGLFNAIGL